MATTNNALPYEVDEYEKDATLDGVVLDINEYSYEYEYEGRRHLSQRYTVTWLDDCIVRSRSFWYTDGELERQEEEYQDKCSIMRWAKSLLENDSTSCTYWTYIHREKEEVA